jgi:phosphate transport system substrate-binding protein
MQLLNTTSFSLKLAGIGLAAAVASAPALAAEITGAGSSFIYPVMSKWSASYSTKTGAKINYQSVGSGAGIAQIKAGTVTFGATDMPLKPAELQAAGLAQFPAIIGGVVPVVNVPGIAPGQMKMSGPVLADIFLAKITKWDDPQIVAMNPGLKLPDSKITVVHRSDGSGTTFNFADYLSKVSPEWKSNVGEGTSLKWPTGYGGKGNEGVAAYVKQIPGSFGYVELAYALQNKMSYVKMKNQEGEFIEPSVESFATAAAGAKWAEPDFYEVITDAPGHGSWPIAASTWVLMYKQPKDAAASKEALAFFKDALEHGQGEAKALDYVSLPPSLVSKIEAYWSEKIK